MAPPSLYQTVGLSAHFWQPGISGPNGTADNDYCTMTPKANWMRSLTREYTALSCTWKAIGGCWSASITFTDDRLAMEWWLQNAVGLSVEIVDEAQGVVWDGFVNELTLSLAGQAITRGPLTEIGNAVMIFYSPADTASDEPVGGAKDTLPTAWDGDSVGNYGVWYKTLTTGRATPVEAGQMVNLYLAERAEPGISRSIDLTGGAGDSQITLECAGWVQRLDWPVRIPRAGGAATANASDQIAAILALDRNQLWSDYSGIEANTLQVQNWTDDDRSAWSSIQAIMALGDAANQRWLFMVEPGLRPVYKAVPTTVAYHQSVMSRRQDITTPGGGRIMPWRVKAGEWVLTPDLLVGAITPATLREDPRAMFIEQITYSAPLGLSLQGGTADRIDQMMAWYGLDGE